MNQNSAARGLPVMDQATVPDEMKDQWYALFAAHNTEGDEVTMASFFSCMKAIGEKMAAL